MGIAILYICTGKYDIFWKAFYVSCERYFLPGYSKDYFVFTDAQNLHAEEGNARIHKIFQERMGWPDDTLLRFKLFSSITNQLKQFDYIFFFNANAEIVAPVSPSKFLPNEKEQLVVALHPGYFNVSPKKFTYESKQKHSTAYISKGKGQHYFAGGVNGGTAGSYIDLINELKRNIESDSGNNIVAIWHDESHLNHYMLNRQPKILSPAYIYPEGWDLPFEPVILIRDKAKLGGHDFLRGVMKKKPFRKRLAAALKRIISK